jgi:hypothetical protein
MMGCWPNGRVQAGCSIVEQPACYPLFAMTEQACLLKG